MCPCIRSTGTHCAGLPSLITHLDSRLLGHPDQPLQIENLHHDLLMLRLTESLTLGLAATVAVPDMDSSDHQ